MATLPTLRSIRRWPTLLVSALLGGIAFAVYSNSFHAGLILDNHLIVLSDPRLRAWTGEHLRQIFTENYWWPSFPSDLYRPLTTLSYLINYAVLGSGEQVAGYHWTNFVLHWVNGCLLFQVTVKLGASRGMAFLAAVLFLIHPVAVESVTNVVGRADLLVAGCILLGTLCLIRASTAQSTAARWGWRSGLASLAAVGVLCKESGVMMVGVVLLYHYLFQWAHWEGPLEERLERARRDCVPDLVALIPMLAEFGWARIQIAGASVVQWQYFADNPIARADFFQGVMTAFKVQGAYLFMLFWPAQLSCDYSYDQVPLYGTAGTWSDATAWASVALLASLAMLAWKVRSRLPVLAFGIVLYLGFMVPTSNLIKVIGSIMAERFLYLPLLGAALVAAWVCERLVVSFRRQWVGLFWPALASVATLCIALGWRAHVRNRDWRDDLSLWRSAAQVAPESFKTHKGLAEAFIKSDYSEKGVDAAIAEAEKGVAILNRPEIDRHIERRDVTLFLDVGRYYGIKADFCRRRHAETEADRFIAQSVKMLLRAAEVDAWVNQEARRLGLNRGRRPEDVQNVGRSDVHRDLSIALLSAGRPREALISAEGSLQLNPFEVAGWDFMAGCFLRMNQPEQAADCAFTALLINFNYAPAWEDLIETYRRLEPAALPVRRGSHHDYALNLSDPLVRRHLLSACGKFDRFLRQQELRAEADKFRAYAVKTFHYAPASEESDD